MGASVNVTDKAFGDPRIHELARRLRREWFAVLGRLICVWRECTERESYVLPEDVFRPVTGIENFHEHLIAAGLAERVPDGIRIRGTEGRIEWLRRRRENAQKAGLARSQSAARATDGTFSRSRGPQSPTSPQSSTGNPAHASDHPASAGPPLDSGPASVQRAPAESSPTTTATTRAHYVPNGTLSTSRDGARESTALSRSDSDPPRARRRPAIARSGPETAPGSDRPAIAAPEPSGGPSGASSSDVRAVFTHWIAVTNRDPARTHLTPKRERLVRTHIRGGRTVADLKLAIDGNHLSAWHQGANDRRQVYDDLELILRDEARVERFMRIAQGPGPDAWASIRAEVEAHDAHD